MENPNVDLISLSEMAVNELEDGNIKNTKSAIREWAIDNELPREIADNFAGIVFEGYNNYEEEGDDEMEYDEMEDDFDENEEYSSDEELDASDFDEQAEAEEYDEMDEDDSDYDTEDEEDEEEAYAMKSAISSLANMESHIYYQSEEIKVINKSLAVLAEALSSIIEQGEKQSDEMNLMKSKLGILAETPANPRLPVYNERYTGHQGSGLSFQETKKLLLKGALKQILTVNEISLYEQTGKLSENAKDFINSEREGR